jgi:Flp pilus assembly pilin Flp
MLKRSMNRKRKGQGLVEYALLIAGVALISAAAVSVFGHKTSDLISAVATILPGAHAGDNAPIVSGHLIETAPDGNGNIALDAATIITNSNGTKDRLGLNVGGSGSALAGEGFGGLVVESN